MILLVPLCISNGKLLRIREIAVAVVHCTAHIVANEVTESFFGILLRISQLLRSRNHVASYMAAATYEVSNP